MTTPTFSELLASQEARDRAAERGLDQKGGPFYMNKKGKILRVADAWKHTFPFSIWQGYLTEAPPPPEPRVFKCVEYRNVYSTTGICAAAWSTRKEAGFANNHDPHRVACKRFELEAIQGQYDD